MNREKGLNEQDYIDPNKISELLEVAKYAAKSGGEELMKHYGSIKSIKSKSNIGDLVTNADIETEKVVLKILQKETPDVSILAEESGSNNSINELVWCVDPLDGTTNFAHGYPFFATSIGLTWKNKPILGSIDIPFLNENYWACPNKGSFCNNKKINVSSKSKLQDSLLVTGFAYDRTSRIDNNYAEFCWLTERTRGVRRGGAAAVDLAFISNGRLDGYWERGLSKWDLAAGAAIVENAGGIISDYKNREFNIETGRILACCPGIEKELRNELNKVKPLDRESYGGSTILDNK